MAEATTEHLDQVRGWRSYAELHAKETDPRRKKMLANMMDHYKWECLGEPDKVLEGVVEDAHYRFYGLGGPAVEMKGHEQIRAFYQNLADTGANVLQLDVDNMLVSDEAIAAHGVWHQVYPGQELLGGGMAVSDKVDDPEGRYLTSQRMAWVMPYNDDDENPKLLGEIVYFHPDLLDIRKLDEGEEVFGPLDESMFRL